VLKYNYIQILEKSKLKTNKKLKKLKCLSILT
jgi:hypothetical protein